MIVGIDMGGTHIDGAIIKDGTIIKTIKNVTDRNDLFTTIWTALKDLIKDINKDEIERINLSTTISTNAIVEKKISKVGMIVQSGPGRNYDFNDLSDQVHFVTGNIDHRGEIVSEISDREIIEIINGFKIANVESVGIVSKFSVRNPSHEKRIKEMIFKDYADVTLGHSLSGKLNFPRRVKTTYLNSAVKKTFNNFAENIEKSLKTENINAPVFILKADGGTMTLDMAKEKPVETILSGPAASFMGLSAMFEESEDGILLDIGGTTTDIFFLLNGQPLFEPLGISIDNHKTLIRAIYSKSIGLGGDSFVRIDDNKILIGPERKGQPIAFGGQFLTPTDAMVALGYLESSNKERSIIAIEKLANKLDLSINETAKKILKIFVDKIYVEVEGIVETINSHPVYTIKELLLGHKLKPKFINVIGGPAKILSSLIKDKFNLEVKYPKDYKVANAIGSALAKSTSEINMHVDTDRGILQVAEVGIYETVDRYYNLEKAKKRAIDILKTDYIGIDENFEAEIVEANSYNMVKGNLDASKNIRVKAQIKPGLIYKLKGEF